MDISELSNHIIQGDAKAAETWTQQALAENMDPLEIVNQGLVPGMAVVGEKFKNFEYYVPEVLVAARAMKWSMALLKPLLADRLNTSLGLVVIGTIKGDLHDIGKNLVAMMLEGAGFEVNDLGSDVTPEAFAKAVEEGNADILCLSALLTTTMPMMKATIDHLKENELRQQVKVLVGGAPVNEKYASQIGADGYAPEAASAVERAKALIGVTAS
ncbi:MAG: corrinoid protein [Dehalococcoidia bacterium]|nr:corrinoid protein [Dehalococcoidia bacterium]MDP7085505.1 corrinoid protein [Dehalococcoidia bacterium]MDP7202018.1 corrinoid protein [Dehalococcoidia bacterium]HJN88146.1 corrinoid protein [Dehalococcoidia bacterium]